MFVFLYIILLRNGLTDSVFQKALLCFCSLSLYNVFVV